MDVDLMMTSAFFLVLENLSNTKGDLHFIQTKSGHLQLIYEPYIFVTDSVRSGRTFWRCMEYGKRCRARITSKNNVLRITNPVHNHTDNHMQKIARKYELGEVVTCPSVWGLLCFSRNSLLQHDWAGLIHPKFQSVISIMIQRVKSILSSVLAHFNSLFHQ